MPLLIKTAGKCTTDHISMAGPWLRFRGHLQNISDNLLMGAVNAFNGQSNSVYNQITGAYEAVSAVAKQYKAQHLSSIVVAEDNYGEGSSREHAAMEPRFLNVKVILAKSFARIHAEYACNTGISEGNVWRIQRGNTGLCQDWHPAIGKERVRQFYCADD